ncbi:M23 family metallopeptidase [Fodinicola feengrottensis]|uniref:M23 family metallopeptidase n=1 Tax=Fodinicola feengrottensis TaxID=435914 RepID=UPI0013D0CAE6|nr:M23 family metallopeptidase [Fodinicola feengrottensis]
MTSAVVGAGVVAFSAGGALPAIANITASGPPGVDVHQNSTASSSVSSANARGNDRASRSQARTAAPKPKSSVTWLKPAQGPLSSLFGIRWGVLHAGVDIAAPYGSQVHASNDGVVSIARWYGGYGNLVEIDHGNGVKTRYGHNSKLLVHEGQKVTAGEVISLVGSTGDSTGPHCHFEVRIDDKAVDPMPWMKARGLDLAKDGEDSNL